MLTARPCSSTTPIQVVSPSELGAGQGLAFSNGTEFARRWTTSGVSNVPGSTAKNPMIKVDIRNLSEAEARELNGIENLERRNLSTADTAWHIAKLAEIAEQQGVKKTDTEIAQQIGLTQSYVSKLLSIMKGVRPQILESWRKLLFNWLY